MKKNNKPKKAQGANRKGEKSNKTINKKTEIKINKKFNKDIKKGRNVSNGTNFIIKKNAQNVMNEGKEVSDLKKKKNNIEHTKNKKEASKDLLNNNNDEHTNTVSDAITTVVTKGTIPNDISDDDPYLLKNATYIQKNFMWTNRQRVLIVTCPLKKKNGSTLMKNLKLLLPHHKLEGNWHKKQRKTNLIDISHSRNCNNILFFQVTRYREYLWICKNITGPSIYFNVLDYIPLHSFKFTGNCLLNSRPLLVFSELFDKYDYLKLIKELFIHVFGIPRYHPLSKPFYDHCYSFFYINNLIYFRHYQIIPITLADSNNVNKQKLVEIGPRFTLNIIKIFEKCFTGKVLYENEQHEKYVSPKQLKKYKQSLNKLNRMKKKFNKIKKCKSVKNQIKTDIDF
ncbi:ribosome biogenesis protein BRX1 homolog, putative [Hepatocystis sp. ex Piliocolobus tephrosceles]|nr:ribosome biogenesis protein BRX1 homolog, putative [Hepatocystis sp. ex Piliocolobus tephrosceles]